MVYPVVLVKLPFTSILNTPSLGLSILKAANQQAGIPTYVIEAEIEFADLIGTDLFADLVWPNTEILFFDALFASVMNPHSSVSEKTFLEKFKNVPLSGPRAEIAKKYVFLQQSKNKGEFLSSLFSYLKPICEKFISNLAAKIIGLDPVILGSTSTTEQTMASLSLFHLIKKTKPEIVTVMGGFNCEGYAGKVLVKNFNCLDVVFSGEAEKEFPLFCSDVLTLGLNAAVKKSPDKTWNQTNAHLRKHEVPCIRLSLDSLNESPTPDFDDYIEQLYQKDCQALSHVVFPFIASRGCWWGEKYQCSFCGLSEDLLKFKSKSAEKIFAEINFLKNKYNARRFVAADLALPHQYHQTLIPKLRTSFAGAISVYYQVKSNMGFKEVSALKQAGIDNVQPGIESFDNEELARMNKGVSGIQNVAFIKYCSINKMTVSWNLLYDRHTTPNEKLCKLDKLLPMLYHLHPPYTIRPLNYPKDSVLYKERDKFHLKLAPHPLYQEIYQLYDQEDIEDLAYCYIDQTPRTNFQDPAVINSLIKKWLEWKKKFQNEAALTYRIETDFIVIKDSRQDSGQIHRMEKTMLPLLEATFSPVSLGELKTKLSSENWKMLDWMIKHEFFYQDGDKVLNLMLEAQD